MENVTPFVFNNKLYIFHQRTVYRLEDGEWRTEATLQEKYISTEKALVVHQKILSWL